VEELGSIPLVPRNGNGGGGRGQGQLIKIISLGSFKEEKDHPAQIRTLFQLRQYLSEEDWDRVRFTIIGVCRNSEDEGRLKDMQDLSKHLSVEENIRFRVNIPFDEVIQELAEASIGIHTTFDDSFGMSKYSKSIH
jgi:alpha-1,2-mannosyltransferase